MIQFNHRILSGFYFQIRRLKLLFTPIADCYFLFVSFLIDKIWLLDECNPFYAEAIFNPL